MNGAQCLLDRGLEREFGLGVGGELWEAGGEERVAGEGAVREEAGRERNVLVMERMEGVGPEPVRWLWHERIALGALTLVTGEMGIGKTFLAADLAARVSRGRAWPLDQLRGEDAAGWWIEAKVARKMDATPGTAAQYCSAQDLRISFDNFEELSKWRDDG